MGDEDYKTFVLVDESTMMMHGHFNPKSAPHAHLPTIFVLAIEVSAWMRSLRAAKDCTPAGSPWNEPGQAASDSTRSSCDSGWRSLSVAPDHFINADSSVLSGHCASAPQMVTGCRGDGPAIFVPEEDWPDLGKRGKPPDSASTSALSSASTIADFMVPSPDSLSSPPHPPPVMASKASRAEEDSNPGSPERTSRRTCLFTGGALGLHDLHGSPALDEKQAPRTETEAEAPDPTAVEAFEQEEYMLLGVRLWGQVLELSSDESDEDIEGAERNCRYVIHEQCLERRAMAIKVPDEGSEMVDERPDFLHPCLERACRGWRARQPPRM